jgi:ABC-type sugar transport system ATPase subunit
VIAVMSGGRIVQIGAPKEIYGNPANLFVARFLGEPGMTIVEGELRDGVFTAPGVTCPAPRWLAGRNLRMAIGVRPEDLVAGDAQSAMMRGLVRTVEFLGSRSLLRADVGAVLATAFLPSDRSFTVGELVGLDPPNEAALHWFDLASGDRLGPPNP